MGQSPDSDSYNDNEDGIPFFQGNADFGEKYPTTRKWCNAPTKIAHAEDILISVRAPIGALNYAKEECCIGRGLAAITPNQDKVSSGFIYWLLKGKHKELNLQGTGSTFKAISRKVLEEIKVPDIELKKQTELAGSLEKVYSVIQLRKQQLEELDILIKARFVEMFGNPEDSGNEWEQKPLSDLLNVIGGYAFKSDQFSEIGGIPVLRIGNINAGVFRPVNMVYWEDDEKLERYAIYAGDLVMSLTGTVGKDDYGNVCIMGNEYDKYYLNQRKVIDNYMTYAQSAIDEFSDPKKMPQIAISVDMLDTGIDVPEVLNLVFFKKVMSKAKFWQMIGRGTRLCPGLLDGEDKQKFYIFDFCGNFEFFRMNKGKATANMIALQGAIFNLKFEISYKLQDIDYQIDRLIAYRKALVKQMSEKVQELPRDNFAVRQHLKYVDLYATEANYQVITYEDTLIVREEVAPLILPDGDEASAVRFDALMYGIELAYLIGKKYTRARSDLHKKVAGIASVANIPEIQAQSELINKILNTDYVDNAGINEFEEIREKLRDLMKYIPRGKIKYETNFSDELLSVEWKESELENDELKNYKAKAEYYIRQHQDNVAIAKLKTNQPLTETDVETLEAILWKEVGTKQDYEHEIGTKPLGEFVREIVGLDMNAAKEAFSEYLTSTSLDSRQIYFVNQIVEYIVHNGMMKDLSVLQESPFTDQGSVVEIFTDLTVWMGIRKVIESINANAAA